MECVKCCYQSELSGILVLGLPSLQTTKKIPKSLTILVFLNLKKELGDRCLPRLCWKLPQIILIL